MSSSDWSYFTYNDKGSTSVAIDSFVASGAEDSNSLKLTASSVNVGETHLWRYNGAQAGQFPAKQVRMSAAFHTTSESFNGFGYYNRWGLYFFGAPLSGAQAQADMDCICFTTYHQRTDATSITIIPSVFNNSIYSGLSRGRVNHIVSNCGGGYWVQYEVALIIDDVGCMDTTDYFINAFIRHNTSSILSAPGSAGWTDWTQVIYGKDFWASTYPTFGDNLKNGVYPCFGFAGSEGSGGWMYVDDIRVNYGVIA